MSVTGVFPGSLGGNQTAPLYRMSHHEFQQLGQDLATGNLSGAQSDLAILEQVFAQAVATRAASGTSSANPLAQAFQQLSTDLKSGNLSGAQKDYAIIQQDLQNQLTGRAHHHPRLLHPTEGPPTALPGQPAQPVLAQQLRQYTSGNGSDPAPVGVMTDPVSFLA